jgi:bifunctional DNA-binding transcriptional regulator/antitoxin component of YhaV-PrlF toxin-antitoxin module
MSRVTSKLQVTLPKALAEKYGIVPGADITWEAAGEVIRVVPSSRKIAAKGPAARLELFDAATARHQKRQVSRSKPHRLPSDRGWTREELYVRGTPR